MRKFVQVRNQLMHPNSSADLKLNAEYRTEVNKGIDWFHVTIKELFRSAMRPMNTTQGRMYKNVLHMDPQNAPRFSSQ